MDAASTLCSQFLWILWERPIVCKGWFTVPHPSIWLTPLLTNPQQFYDLLYCVFPFSTTAPILDAVCSEFLAVPLLTPSLVECLIGNLDTNIGLGPDGLPNCKQYINFPLCIIFNKNHEECYFPYFWKEALVISILKSIDPPLVVNYSPSLFPPLAPKSATG